MPSLVESLETIVAELRAKHAQSGRDLEMGERMLAEAKDAAAAGSDEDDGLRAEGVGTVIGEPSERVLALGKVSVNEGMGFLVAPKDSKGRSVYDVRVVTGQDGYAGKGKALVEVYGRDLEVHGMGQAVFASGEVKARTERDVVASCRGIHRFNSMWSKGERGRIRYLGDITVNEEMVNLLANEGKGHMEPWVSGGGDVENGGADMTNSGSGVATT